MVASTQQFQTSKKTRILYAITSLGVATPAEAIAGIIAFCLANSQGTFQVHSNGNVVSRCFVCYYA